MNATRSSSHYLWQAAVWQPLKASYGRTLLSIIAIALGVALGFSIDAMNRAATSEMIVAARSLFGQADLVVQGTSQGFDENLYTTIAHTEGVAVASPVLQVEVRLADGRGNLALLGIDLLRAARFQPAIPTGSANYSIRRGKDGLSIFDPQSLLLSASAARALHANIGDFVTVQVGTQPVTFKVSGVLPAIAYPHNVGLLDIAAAQWRLGWLGKLTRIDLRLSPGADAKTVAAIIARQLPTDAKVTTSADESRQSIQLSHAFTINLTALALVALFTGAFLVYSTQSLAVMRRRKEFALLHALGVTRREQIKAVILTGVLLGMIGALLGIFLGAALADVGLKLFLGNLNVGFTPRLSFSILEITVFVSLGIFGSIAGSLAPALAASRIPTAQALKSGDIDESAIANKRNAAPALWLGLLFWVSAPLLLLLPPIGVLPLPGYCAIAFVLLGAVMLIPIVTHHVISWLPRGRNITYQVAIAQLRGTAGKATISVATILVSVSLMVAMGIMVASLRGSFADSLDKTLPADVYVSAGNTQSSYLDAETVNLLMHIAGVAQTAATRSIEIYLAKDRPPGTLIARPLAGKEVGATLLLEIEARKPLPDDAIPIWISVAMGDRYHLSADDEFNFPLNGRMLRGSVRGVWRNNGPFNDAIAMDIDRYRQLTNDNRVNSLGLWLQRDVSVEKTLQLIRASLPSDAAIDLGVPSEMRANRLAGFDRVFAVTYLLEAVAVLIGLFGISVSASAQALARRAEFGVLRHLGFTRGQIGRLLVLEGFGLGSLGVLAGLCVGGVISMILIYVVGRQSFNWTMDIHVPVMALAALALVIPLAASLTALWSGRSAMGVDVVRAVKEDW